MYASISAFAGSRPNLLRATHFAIASLVFGYLALIVSGVPFW
jgi:hypothetical protein